MTIYREPPLVSIGIPLYRSAQFLGIIFDNIEAIEYPNIEIVISDRHQFDDALAQLKARYESDARFRFLEGEDRLNWVENFNLILNSVRGKYFLWMAHDDTYSPNYIGDLVAALEDRPDAVLAFGRVEQVSLDGFLPTFPFTPPPTTDQEEWTLASSLRLLTLWQLWIAFRGLYRLKSVKDSHLRIRQTYGNIRADIYWVFAVSLRGRLRYVESCLCVKRFHRSSGGAGWRFGVRQSLNACRVLNQYLSEVTPSPQGLWIGRLVICLWCCVQGFLPSSLARQLGILTRRALLHRRN